MSSATTGGLGKKSTIAAITPKPRGLDAMSPARLKGVGPALEKKLAAIGITSIQDLLFHLPLVTELLFFLMALYVPFSTTIKNFAVKEELGQTKRYLR